MRSHDRIGGALMHWISIISLLALASGLIFLSLACSDLLRENKEVENENRELEKIVDAWRRACQTSEQEARAWKRLAQKKEAR